MTENNTALRHCGLCGIDVHEVAWIDSEPGGHVVLVETPMSFSHEPDGDVIRVTVEQKVGLPLCRTLGQRFAPMAPDEALRASVEGAAKFIPGATQAQVREVADRVAKWLEQSGYELVRRD